MRVMVAVKKDFYLEVPLVVFHQHCLEWMEDIAFWKIEIKFLYKLVHRGMKNDPGVFKSAEAKKVEKQLLHISAQALDEWLREIKDHEKFLNKVLKKPRGQDEDLYRTQHKKLAERFRKFEIEYRRMKKKIFSLSVKDGKKTKSGKLK